MGDRGNGFAGDRRPRRIDLLEGLSGADAGELESMAESVDLERGETVYRRDDAADRLFLVRSGAIKLFRASADGKEVNLVVVGSGDLFGEQVLVGESRRQENAQTLEPSTVWAFGGEAVGELVSRRPALALQITRIVGKRLQRVETKMQDMLFSDVRTRLAHMLVDLALDFGESCPGGRRIRHRLTQTDLAQLIGSTRETTSTIFNEFRRDGLVDRDNGRILVLEIEALRRYPDDGG